MPIRTFRGKEQTIPCMTVGERRAADHLIHRRELQTIDEMLAGYPADPENGLPEQRPISADEARQMRQAAVYRKGSDWLFVQWAKTDPGRRLILKVALDRLSLSIDDLEPQTRLTPDGPYVETPLEAQQSLAYEIAFLQSGPAGGPAPDPSGTRTTPGSPR